MGLFSRHEEGRTVKPKKLVKHMKKKYAAAKKSAPKSVVRPAKVVAKTATKTKIVKHVEKRTGMISEADAVYDLGKLPVTRNVTESKTRAFRPKIDIKKCQKTYNCFLFCPRGAILINPEGYPVINYALCDGCLICLRECPSVAIIEERE